MPIDYKPVATVKPEEARRTAAIPDMRLEYPHVRFTQAIAEAIGQRGAATIQYGNTMATVAGAIGTLGKAVSGAGDEMWQRATGLAQLEVEKQANDATIGYEQSQTERNEKFKSLQGTAADSKALQAFLTESESARQAIKGTLSPAGQAAFDRSTTYSYIRDARMAASHASEQTKAATAGSYEARGKMAIAGMANSTEDADFERGKADFAEVTRNLQQLHGWTDEKRAFYYTEGISHAIASRATLMADKQPNAAMQYLEENKKGMDPDRYQRAYNSIKGKINQAGARSIADGVQTEAPNASLEDKLILARKKAEAYNPGDTDLKEFAESKTTAMHNRQKAAEAETYNRSKDTTWDIVNSEAKPKSKDEAMALPGFKEAFNSLDESDQKKVIMGLDYNANPEYTGPEAERVFQDLDGQLSNKETRREAMGRIAADMDIINRAKTTKAHRDQLYHKYRNYQSSGKSTEADLRTDHGEGVLKSNGWREIFKKMGPHERSIFDSNFGAQAEELRRLQQGKPLTDEQWLQLGNKLNQDLQTPGIFFGVRHTTYSKTLKPDINFTDTYRELHPNAGDIEIQRAYAKQRLREDLGLEEKRKVK